MTLYVGGYETELRERLDMKCRELDLDLVLVYGGALQDPKLGIDPQNWIFEAARPDNNDGLIVVTTVLASALGPEPVRHLVDKFGGIPLCSVGLELPGHPSVSVDNRSGMEAVVEHLILHHNCRRPAFIAGAPNNPEARTRLKIYQEMLIRHGIEPDPSLVATGDFLSAGGYAAMQEILQRGSAFDAVVASNDTMAFAAISALREHGFRPPHDLPVTGFDNVPLARFANPPLTTVAQPFDTMAELALELVVKQMGGQSVAETNRLPSELVIRQSCGCAVRSRRISTNGPVLSETESAVFLREQAETVGQVLAAILRTGGSDLVREAPKLLDALERELTVERGAFLHKLEDVIADGNTDLAGCRALEEAILGLRSELMAFSTPELETLWHNARDVVGQASTRVEFLQQVELDRSYQRMHTAGAQMAPSLDLASLTRVLEQALPDVGIRTALYSRFVPDSPGELELFLCLVDGHPQTPNVRRFSERHLLPAGLLPASRRMTWLVFPVSFESWRLGVSVFEYAPQTRGYPLLRDQIASGLHAVALYQEVREQTLLHERSVQERFATTQRLEALSILAGGVAHDLNNSLGPLVALPDVILHELANPDAVADLRLDIETIKRAALRASQTIKDLLTLGRKGRTTKEPVDLNVLVQACLVEASLRSRSKTAVAISTQLQPTPLFIHASEAHIMRAITNLVRNAVEAIEGPGQVVIKTQLAVIHEPIHGYETIDPGDYAVATVSDNGSGIAPVELGRVFEPFFSKKRLGDSSGSGLGLAIVHGVVKEHEGFVDVSSTLGGGTTFSLYFPRTNEVRKSSRTSEITSQGHARILIVDDEPIQLRTGRRVLAGLGYEVDTFQSGQQAFEALTEAAAAGTKPYDVVILDLILNEERDGLDLFDEIQRLFPNQRAIVASGHAPTERAELAISNGLGWLAKPYTRDGLVSAVQAVIANRPSNTVIKVPTTKPPGLP